MTQVKFLYEKDSTDVYAYFPQLPFTVDEGKDGLFTCYAPIGQHSACHVDYANECKEAIHNQYHKLLLELVGQGYKDLVVMNSEPIKCYRKPTIEEINFGLGVTHYRDFTIAEIGIAKTGWIKSWFISKDDGLRYNHY